MAKKKYSGNLIIRINPTIHEALSGIAEKKFMSLNGLINSILDKEVKAGQKKSLVVSK